MNFIKDLAKQHKVDVVYKSINGSEAFVIGNAIYLDPDLYPPRMNWRFCHELAHLILKHPDNECISRSDEIEADNLAAELMLPQVDFKPLVREIDIPALKETFPHASWEVIARRWAQFRPAVVTIIDDMRLKTRWAPEGLNYPYKVTNEELEIIKRCFLEKTNVSQKHNPLIMSAYFIDEGTGVKRVILLTEVDS